MTALAELVGKPVRSHFVNSEGINTTITGTLLRVEEDDTPWAPDSQRVVIDHEPDNSEVVIDPAEVVGITWDSALNLILRIDFGDSELYLADRSRRAQMLNTEIRVGKHLAITDEVRWRHERLRWLRGVVIQEREQVDEEDRQRLDHIIAFLEPYREPPAGGAENIDDLKF